MILSITFQSKRINILCVNSNVLFPIKGRLKTPIPTTKYLVIMLFFNGKQGRLPPILSLSLNHITLSHVLFILVKKMFTTGEMENIPIDINA